MNLKLAKLLPSDIFSILAKPSLVRLVNLTELFIIYLKVVFSPNILTGTPSKNNSVICKSVISVII